MTGLQFRQLHGDPATWTDDEYEAFQTWARPADQPPAPNQKESDMDLTVRYVNDSRQVVDGVDAADITNPDHPRAYLATLITQATETLRTITNHAERLAEKTARLSAEADGLRSRNAALEAENARLRKEAAELAGMSNGTHSATCTA
jgi:FtsZ-binding cell division protein ZapB